MGIGSVESVCGENSFYQDPGGGNGHRIHVPGAPSCGTPRNVVYKTRGLAMRLNVVLITGKLTPK